MTHRAVCITTLGRTLGTLGHCKRLVLEFLQFLWLSGEWVSLAGDNKNCNTIIALLFFELEKQGVFVTVYERAACQHPDKDSSDFFTPYVAERISISMTLLVSENGYTQRNRRLAARHHRHPNDSDPSNGKKKKNRASAVLCQHPPSTLRQWRARTYLVAISSQCNITQLAFASVGRPS